MEKRIHSISKKERSDWRQSLVASPLLNGSSIWIIGQRASTQNKEESKSNHTSQPSSKQFNIKYYRSFDSSHDLCVAGLGVTSKTKITYFRWFQGGSGSIFLVGSVLSVFVIFAWFIRTRCILATGRRRCCWGNWWWNMHIMKHCLVSFHLKDTFGLQVDFYSKGKQRLIDS